MSTRQRIRVSVLGPLRLRDADGHDLTPAGELPRRLLAMLVLERGRSVPTSAAIDALWPAALPADPSAALQNHVSRLRRGLPEGTIESTQDGYRLAPDAIEVDADRLARAVSADALDDAATDEIEAILTAWQGPAYPELGDVDAGRRATQQLDELHVRARERRADALLAAGATDGLATELQQLADAHPLRERPRALLMEVLAATGRHVDALRVFDEFRRALGDELGIEPSPALTSRHADLLSGVSEWTPGAALPVPLTSLFGRDDLVDELAELASSARLLTLVGPGGVGKSRVCLEVGHRLAGARPDVPVVACDLSSADPSSAAAVIARALRIDMRPGVPLADRVVSIVGDAEMVLLLDNCEHVVDSAADFVMRVTTGCARLRVLATSRERLRVAGEQVRNIPPLPVDHDAAPAVELFVDRARAAGGIDVDAAALATIGEIVARLDGIPLAIELAAARMHSHDLDEIAAGLDQPFDLLASGYRGSRRHGSLAAAVSWSYRLLDADLQRTFAEIAVFAGPFDVAGAAAVCAVEDAVANDRLTELTERSLLLRAPGRRYRQLETLRAFGNERLDADGTRAEVERRHADHLVRWIEDAADRLQRPGDVVSEIDEAVPTLQRAFECVLDQGDIDAAGRIVRALADYGFFRLRPDILSWTDRLTAVDQHATSRWSGEVWAVAGYAAWMAGDTQRCGECATRALELAATDPPPPRTLAVHGLHTLAEGRLHESADWYRRASEVASAGGNYAFAVFALGTFAMTQAYAGEPAAVAQLDRALERIGDDVTPYAAYAWYCAGEAALALGQDRAREHLERAVRVAEATNAAFVVGVAGASKASIDARFGDPVEAALDYRRLIEHWRRAGMWPTQWTMLRSITALLERLGRDREAAVLGGAIRATTAGHRVFGADEVMLGEVEARVRARLGDAAFETARREGAALDGDAAADYALRVL